MFLPAPVYIFTFLLTAREGSANTSQQYENTPEAVMYLKRKKKKKSMKIHKDGVPDTYIYLSNFDAFSRASRA